MLLIPIKIQRIQNVQLTKLENLLQGFKVIWHICHKK